MIRRSINNLLMFGPYGKAEDLAKQIQLPWEIEGTIKRITLKKRQWKNQTIIQGFQVHTKEGLARACGMNYNDLFDTETFDIPEYRYVSKVRIAAKSYIHSLTLVLDNGEVLGPFGGTGNVNETIVPEDKNLKTMLRKIEGIKVQSEKLPVIAQVKFGFSTE